MNNIFMLFEAGIKGHNFDYTNRQKMELRIRDVSDNKRNPERHPRKSQIYSIPAEKSIIPQGK